MSLHVVIPTYNEAQNLPKLLEALFALPIEGLEVLIVDDNSPDGTWRIAERMAAGQANRISVLRRPGKLGLGSAYINGFQRALEDGAKRIAQMDADFSHPPEMLPVLLEALDSCDVALGSRYIPGGGVDKKWPVWRKALSGFGNVYARTILYLPVRDVTGGFKVWRRETLQKIPLQRVRSNGYAFQVEMTYITHRLGFSFKEKPFYFADRSQGRSKMSFQIQMEAAIRVWTMLYEYRDLRPSLSSS